MYHDGAAGKATFHRSFVDHSSVIGSNHFVDVPLPIIPPKKDIFCWDGLNVSRLQDIYLDPVSAGSWVCRLTWHRPGEAKMLMQRTGGLSIWGFPEKYGVPPVIIHCCLGFSLIDHPFGGSPIYGNFYII